jgi:Protease inhibitor Inh
MVRCRLAVVVLIAAALGPGAAANAQDDSATPMVGAWELSNADHDKICMIRFKLEPAGPGHALEFEKGCAESFPQTREISAWMIGKDDGLRLVDSKGKPVFELTEVENGLFEPLHPGDSLVFLQTQAAAQGRERTADTMFGEWALARSAGKPICRITLNDVAHDADSFALDVKPGCDTAIANFAPSSWRMERGLLLLLSGTKDPWRFEEEDSGTWHRIPSGRHPLLLVRQ